MKISKLFLLAFSCLTAVGCGRDAEEPQAEVRSVEVVADEYLEAMLERYPEMMTYYSLPEARHDDLFDNSLDTLAEWQAREDAWLRELDAIGRAGEIGSRDWTTFGILYEELASSVETRVCRSELWNASSATAWHNNLPLIFELQPLATSELREQALVRLRKVPSYIDNEIVNLRRGLALGYSAPRVTVETVPAEIRELLGEGNPFMSMFTRTDDDDFESRGRKIVETQIAPALERFAAFVEEEYLPQAREVIALSANPDGAACYPTLVRSHSTLGIPADRIHEIGLEELTSILGEVREIIDNHFGGGGASEFFQQVITDPEFTFETEDEVLQHSLDVLAAVRLRMPEYFNLMPRADVIIKPYPAYRGGATGEYQSSSEDGSRPGNLLHPCYGPHASLEGRSADAPPSRNLSRASHAKRNRARTR